MNRLPIRQCVGCGNDIHECMGFVKAGDILDSLKPREPGMPYAIRELCGRCVERYRWTADGVLEETKEKRL